MAALQQQAPSRDSEALSLGDLERLKELKQKAVEDSAMAVEQTQLLPVKRKRMDDEEEIDDEDEYLLAQAITERESHMMAESAQYEEEEEESSTILAHIAKLKATPMESTSHCAPAAKTAAVGAAPRTPGPSPVQPAQPLSTPMSKEKHFGWNKCVTVESLRLPSSDCALFEAPSNIKGGDTKWTVEVAKLKPFLNHLESLLTGGSKVKDQEIKGDLTALKRLATEKTDKRTNYVNPKQGAPTTFSVRANAIKEILSLCKDLRAACLKLNKSGPIEPDKLYDFLFKIQEQWSILKTGLVVELPVQWVHATCCGPEVFQTIALSLPITYD